MKRDKNKWVLGTTNIRRFGFVQDKRHDGISSWTVDDTEFLDPPKEAGPSCILSI